MSWPTPTPTGTARIVFTRSSDLSSTLDSDATAQVARMISEGWEPDAAAGAWVDWIQVVAESAADAALAEGSWEAG